MNVLTEVTHDLKNGLIGVTLEDEKGVLVHCHLYGMAEMEDFKVVVGESAQKHLDIAGWSPEALVKLRAKIDAEVAEKQAIADAEEADRKVKRAKEEKDAFDAEVAKQVAILKAAQAIVSKKK